MIISIGDDLNEAEKQGTFVVTANIYSEAENDYVAHWDGGTFSNYEQALEFWDEWAPPKDEIDKIMISRRANGDHSHYELEIGIWCDGLDYDLPFINMTLDQGHEKGVDNCLI